VTTRARPSYHAIRDRDHAKDDGGIFIRLRTTKRVNSRSIETSSNTDSYIEHPLLKSTRSPYPYTRQSIHGGSPEESRYHIQGNKAIVHDQRRILKHAYRRDEKLELIQDELVMLMKTRSSYRRSWPLLWRATKCS